MCPSVDAGITDWFLGRVTPRVLIPAPSLRGIAAYPSFAATHRNPSLKPDAPAALRHHRALIRFVRQAGNGVTKWSKA